MGGGVNIIFARCTECHDGIILHWSTRFSGMENECNAVNFQKRFALIGAAGYIAPRHFRAVKTLGHNMIAAHDVFDSVGVIDSYFPEASFTTDFSEFMYRIRKEKADYLTVCTPNDMHCPHSIAGLEAGVDVICEKPLTLTLDELERMNMSQIETGHNIWTILQLRLHPEIVRLKKMIEEGRDDVRYDVDLAYITPRGKWYGASWKGDEKRSGGLATNIGVHFIDMLHWVFGSACEIIVHHVSHDCVAGFMDLEKARIRFFLSINPDYKPADAGGDRMSAYRQIVINGESIDFTGGFTDLHTLSYARIIDGEGFSIDQARAAVSTLEVLRNANAMPLKGECHPLALKLRTLKGC